MSKADLKAEAKAWREWAKACATYNEEYGDFPRYLCNRVNGPLLLRVSDHSKLHDRRGWPKHEEGSTLDVKNVGMCAADRRNDTRVIFCLLMALECEEEARHAPR